MSDSIKSIIAITLLCMGAGCVTTFFHSSLAASIDSGCEIKKRSLAKKMFPEHAEIISVKGIKPLPSLYYIGKMDSMIIGYVFPIAAHDYAGEIAAIIGIDTSGTILGMSIVSENRTPGIGLSLEDRLSAKSLWDGIFRKKNGDLPWFTEQFKGMRINKPFSIGDSVRTYSFTDAQKEKNREGNIISALTGATMSTRTIVRTIEKNAVTLFACAKDALK